MIRQKGFVNFSGLVFLAMLYFCGFLAFKALPLYYENYQINNVLQNMVNDKQANYTIQQKPAIFKSIVKRFQVNHIKTVKTTDVQIESKGGKLMLSVSYDAKAKLFGNLYFLAHFSNKAVRS